MTQLDPNFLVACLRMSEFTRQKMLPVTAGLLALALRGHDFTAADIPANLTEGSPHRAGAATGGLIAAGLLIVVGRVNSPRENAKGRKLDVLRLAPGKRQTALTWFDRNGLPVPPEHVCEQQEMAL